MRAFHLALLPLAILLTCCSCVRHFPGMSGQDARDMMAQTVFISVEVGVTEITKAENGRIVAVENVLSWSGSGVVVAYDGSKGKGESLVMSAAHVTNVPPVFIERDDKGNITSLAKVENVLLTAVTLDGRTCDAEQIYSDVSHDISVIRVLCKAGEVAEIADSLPPVGSVVSISGAGLGFHPVNVFLVTDGRYVGLEDGEDPGVVVTLPLAPGHSGSGLFYNGEVFAIATRRFVRFEHGSFGTALPFLKIAFKEAMETWNGR